MNDQHPRLKVVASVRDIARAVGLSPARFYKLLKAGVFPPPCYDIATRRPFYTREQQLACLEVREGNCGVNGQPVLFYARRRKRTTAARRLPAKQKVAAQRGAPNADILAAVRSLGLRGVRSADVESALQELFPAGVDGIDRPELIRSVFLRLKRTDADEQPRPPESGTER